MERRVKENDVAHLIRSQARERQRNQTAERLADDEQAGGTPQCGADQRGVFRRERLDRHIGHLA